MKLDLTQRIQGLLRGRSALRRLEQIEKKVHHLLEIEPPPAGSGLAAGVLADSGGRADADPAVLLVERILVERLGVSGRAQGLIGAGLLSLAEHPPGDTTLALMPGEASDLDGLAGRLASGSWAPRDAARAGAFLQFMLDTYQAAGVLALARAMQVQDSMDAACQSAIGKSAAMLELQWSECQPHEQGIKGAGPFLRWTVGLLRPYRFFTVMLVVGILVQTAYAMLMPIWLNQLFDQGITPGRADVIWRTLAYLVGGFLVTAMGGLAIDFSVSTLGPRTLNDVRGQVFDKLMSISSRALNRFKSGDMVSIFATDIFIVENAIVRAIPGIVGKGFLMLGSLVTAVTLDWRMALATILFLTVAFWAPRQVGRFAVRASYARKLEDGKLAGFIKETVQLLPVIRTLHQGAHRRSQFDVYAGEMYKASYKQYLLGELTGRATVFAISAAQLGIIGLGAILSLNGTVSGGVVVAYIGLLLAFGGAAGSIATLLPTAIQAIGSWQRIDWLLAQPTDVPVAEGPAPADGPLTRLEFRDVSFSYRGERLNLDNVSLEAPLPRRIALVGPSGSGKSTMIHLLSHQYDPVGGRIMLNDTDIRDIGTESLSSLMGVVNQDTTLFEGSIRYNICIGRLDATDAQVEAAARAAEIHDFIKSLPDGYDTNVGEGGKLLSGGQRQRIVIARVLLRNPQLLLLDEATSALDAESEAAINDTLARVSADRTMISVTHRLAACPDMDLICVFHEGRLAESGTHDELLAQRGIYAGMWEKQTDISIVNAGQEVDISVEGLRKIPLFSSAPVSDLERIRGMLHVEEVPAGTVLTQESTTTGRFYIIARGSVECSIQLDDGTSLPMEVLEVGDFFGEFALLEGVPHPTTCRTMRPCLLLSLSRQELRRVADLNRLTNEQSELEREIAATLDRRLDAKLDELIERRRARRQSSPAGGTPSARRVVEELT